MEALKYFTEFFDINSLPLLVGAFLILFLFYKYVIDPKLNSLKLIKGIDTKLGNLIKIIDECESLIKEVKNSLTNLLLEVNKINEYEIIFNNIIDEIKELKDDMKNNKTDKEILEKINIIFNNMTHFYDFFIENAKLTKEIDSNILEKIDNFYKKLDDYKNVLHNKLYKFK